MVLIYQYNRLRTTLIISFVSGLFINQKLLYYGVMETIKNFSSNSETEDPLAFLWGMYNTQIAPTGRIDSEFDAFKNIEARILSKQITGQEGIKEAWAIVNGRQE